VPETLRPEPHEPQQSFQASAADPASGVPVPACAASVLAWAASASVMWPTAVIPLSMLSGIGCYCSIGHAAGTVAKCFMLIPRLRVGQTPAHLVTYQGWIPSLLKCDLIGFRDQSRNFFSPHSESKVRVTNSKALRHEQCVTADSIE
jgi:hypothetical protein